MSRFTSCLTPCRQLICLLVLSNFNHGYVLASDVIPQGAITLLHNAQIYTVNPAQPWAEAMAYDDSGSIIAVGTLQGVEAAIGSVALRLDAQARMVLPGFIDTHVHVPEAGINESLCLLPANKSIDVYENLIRQCAKTQSEDHWVRAAGASLFNLRDSDELPLDVLDRAVPDRPVLVLDDLGHAIWTNSKGLQEASITADSPDPQGGVLLRDSKTGLLTGLLLEDVQQLVRNAAATDADTNYKGLLSALGVLAENGITAISDAGGYWAQGHVDAWLRAEAAQTLSVRAANSLYVYPDMNREEQLASFKRLYKNDPLSLLQFNSAKIYIDGILDLGTALLLKPYNDPVDSNYPSGFSYFKTKQLNDYVEQLSRMGYRAHFHVIGDKAVRLALDSIEALSTSAAQMSGRAHRTTHTYMVDRADMPRFAQLGVVADMQVGQGSTDLLYHDDLYEIIGERAYELLPVPEMLEAGAKVSLSSDWDADPLSPLGIIQRSMLRDSHAIDDLGTAIRLVTRDAAFALGLGGVTGALVTGLQADFVVLDQNVFELPLSDIENTSVLMTVLAGRQVFKSWDY
jgi:predicted amidohydrolase YtcJ